MNARYWLANFALLLAGFATFASLYDVQPLLPALSAQFGVAPATASLALSASTIALAAALFVAGSLSESLGRKLPIVASLGLSSAITFLCALVPNSSSLLALHVNGSDLSPDHGYPARVIVPAAPGVHNTKWVTRLTFGS